jgi:hypothetical protein
MKAAMLVTFTIAAPPSKALAARSGRHASASRKAPKRFTRTESSKTSGSHSLGWKAKAAPALFTSTSSAERDAARRVIAAASRTSRA